jgi:hypothetical protein
MKILAEMKRKKYIYIIFLEVEKELKNKYMLIGTYGISGEGENI